MRRKNRWCHFYWQRFIHFKFITQVTQLTKISNIVFLRKTILDFSRMHTLNGLLLEFFVEEH